jgi:Stage II sporulation protein M
MPFGVDDRHMDASSYAFVRGISSTRATLGAWNRRPWPVLRSWLLGSLAAALLLLAAVWLIAVVSLGPGPVSVQRPPFQTGTQFDAVRILSRNSLVLALHAMACVAGFIAGSSLPLQARSHSGLARVIHERGGRLAIVFVVAATAFSLSAQALVLGLSVGHVAYALHTTPGLLLLGLLPHAIPELMALFLPLAAWIIASRRGDWDELLAATLVTVAIAVPILVVSALWEVYMAPHVLGSLLG